MTISLAPFARYLNIKILGKKDGYSKLSLSYQSELANHYGYLHGGAMGTLADSTMAVAVHSRYFDDIFYTAKQIR